MMLLSWREGVYLDQIWVQGRRCIERLWKEVQEGLQILVCADGCWPADEAAHAKFAALTENILRNVAGLKWRILTRFEFPPWSLARLSAPHCGADQVPWQLQGSLFFDHAGFEGFCLCI